MQVRLKDIGPEGLRLSRELDQVALGAMLHGVDAMPEGAAGRVTATITRAGSRIFVHAVVSGRFRVACARCLEPADVVVDAPAHVTYVPALVAETAEKTLEEDDELDLATYKGEEIDLSDLIRDQVLLAIPMVPLCKSDCCGLCPHCGTNRNENPCDCRNPEVRVEKPLAQLLGALRKS